MVACWSDFAGEMNKRLGRGYARYFVPPFLLHLLKKCALLQNALEQKNKTTELPVVKNTKPVELSNFPSPVSDRRTGYLVTRSAFLPTRTSMHRRNAPTRIVAPAAALHYLHPSSTR